MSLVPASLTARDLEAFLHQQIPLSVAMQLHVARNDATGVTLEAPLEPNRNHLGTAFGGSLHAVPTLACYAALWTILREAGIEGHVVIKRSQIYYRQPVTGTIRAECARPSAPQAADFINDLRRHKKARMELTATVQGTNGKPAVEFEGSFVALFSA